MNKKKYEKVICVYKGFSDFGTDIKPVETGEIYYIEHIKRADEFSNLSGNPHRGDWYKFFGKDGYHWHGLFKEVKNNTNNTVMRNLNKYQKSPLSLEPGGDTVKVTFKNGGVRIYHNIKDVSAYTAKVISESERDIDRIEFEKEVVTTTKEWRALFGRGNYYGVLSNKSYDTEI
jgi:hypothetical protein